jgi:DNA-directed RNA polymerase subunit RPC12/RpoP
VDKEPTRTGGSRRITETKNTCTACGRIWYYGKADSLEQTGAALENLGKDMMCCSGCAPAALIPDKKVVDLDRCPDCGSKAVVSEKVTHEVE